MLFQGLVLDSHQIKDKKSKLAATKNLHGWEYQEKFAEEWMKALEQGKTIVIGDMSPLEDDTWTHKESQWNGTYFVCCDADNFKGVEFDAEGNDKNPEGEEAWQEKELVSRYPSIKEKVYAVQESVSSMITEHRHRRYRLIFRFDEKITDATHYRQILLALAQEFPVIAPVERQPSQPVFGNGSERGQVHIHGKILNLADYPFEPKRTGKANDRHLKKTLSDWLDLWKIPYTVSKEPNKFFVVCPYKEQHTDGVCNPTDAYVFDDGDGFAYYCSHHHCKDKRTWQAFKDGHGIENQKFSGGARAGAGRPKSPLTVAREESPYFLGNKFNVVAMRERVTSQFTCWSHNQEVHIYDAATGVYAPGEDRLETFIRLELDALASNQIVSESLGDLRSMTRREQPQNSQKRIPFENGVLDFETLQLHEHSPENLLLHAYPLEWAPSLENPTFDKFVSQVVPEDAVGLIYQMIGSIFHQESPTMQTSFLLVGDGSNGKSLLLDILVKLLGEQAICSRAWIDFGRKDFAEGDLYQRSLAMDTDIHPNIPLDSAIKKAITGDTLNCNQKYKDTFPFKPYATWIGCINGLPKSNDKSFGFFRRWMPISFPRTFEKSTQFERELKDACLTPIGKSGIVSKAVNFYREAWTGDSFDEPASSLKLKDRLEVAHDSVAGWIEDCVEIRTDMSISKNEVIDSYMAWCDENGVQRPDTRAEVYSKLRRHGCDTDIIQRVDGDRQKIIKGLTLS